MPTGTSPAQVDELALSSYQDDFDVSKQTAEERLKAQEEGAGIVEWLQKSQGKRYAGVWFDNESGEFVVPTAASEDRGAVAETLADTGIDDDYRTKPVESSWDQLEAAQDRIDDALGALIEEGLVGTGLDPRTNAVFITLAAGAGDSQRAEVQAAARAERVEVEVRESQAQSLGLSAQACQFGASVCDAPMRGGVNIVSDGSWRGTGCTAGFKGIGDIFANRFVLTAGHCIYGEGTVWDSFTATLERKNLGQAAAWSYPVHDWAAIKANGTYWDKPSWPVMVTYWGVNQEFPISYESFSWPGQYVCHAGQQSGVSCGTVTGIHLTEPSEDDAGNIFGYVSNLTRIASICSTHGDSGGPVFTPGNVALGIYTHSDKPPNAPPCYYNGYYNEITEATDAMGVHVAPRVGSPPMGTTVTLDISLPSCPQSTVRVSGAANANGQVTVSFWRWEGGQWTLKGSPQYTAANGSYQGPATLGAGKWRAKAALSSTESPYKEFVIACNANEEDSSSGPRVFVDPNGALHILYRDQNGKLGHQWLVKGSETWGSEVRSVATAMAGDPRVIVDTSGFFHVFYRETNGNIGHQWIALGGSSWGSEVRPASAAGDPRVIVDPDGAIHVFYRQTDGKLGHQWLVKGSESWSGEVRSVATSMTGDPQLLYDSSGVFHVFYRETSGNIGHQWIAPGAPSWGSEVRPVNSIAGDPRVIVDPDGAIHVFYRQTDGKLGHQWLVKGSESWSGEVRSVASSMASDPRILYDNDKALHIFYAETSGNMGHQWINYGATWWGSEVRPVSSIGSAPKPLIDSTNVFHLFYRETSGNMGHQWIAPGAPSWGGEVRPVNAMASGPAPLLDTNGAIHAFYRETGSNVGHQWLAKGSETWGGEVRPGSSMLARPPLASTGATSGANGDTITVKGSVTPEGSMTDYYFEYGPTTSYGSKQPSSPKNVGDGSGAFTVSEVLGGLAPATTYHYRVVATSPEGTTKGADATFTTPSFPAVTTKEATGVTSTGATLSADVNPKGFATTYSFEYGKTIAYGSSTSSAGAGSGTTAVSVSQTISNLTPETLYHYRVVATNGQGTARGADLTFTATPNLEAKLNGLGVTEPFDGSSASLSRFAGNWSALGWASGSSPKGQNTSTGWGPSNAFPTVNGAYFSTSLTDSGLGVAVAARLAARPSTLERYFSLWLDMQSPAGARAGYELRFTETAANVYEAKLSKWQSGSQSVLASKAGVSLPVGSSFALADKGASVSAWLDTGSGFGSLLSAGDSSFGGGNAGIEGAGNFTRLADFRFNTLLGEAGGVEGRWYLRNANAPGVADVEFVYGGSELLPVSGDWNKDGTDTPGAYKPSTGEWFLRNSNTGGSGEINFTFGGCCDLLPVAGDWNNDGTDTPGLFKPSTNGEWFLRNSNTTGGGEINFTYGGPSMSPVVGDWNKDGIDTPGLYKQNAEWFLRNSNSSGVGEINFLYGGGSGGKSIAGDWNKDGTDTVGMVR